MPLTPRAKVVVDLASRSFPRLGTEVLDATRARRLLAARPQPQVEPIPVGRVEERFVPGPDGAPDVLVRVYWPRTPQVNPGFVVFCHGGGWVICDLDSHDQLCRAMANASGSIVVSVDYRRAPEHRFPAAAEDTYAVVRWIAGHGAELNGDPARIAVAGDSAGGNLAAASTLMARDRGGPRIAFQLLLYPMLDHARDTRSHTENGQGYFVTADHLRWYWEQYLGDGRDGEHAYASPLRAADLSGLPPAHIVTAQYDPLRDEGEAYGEHLRAAGVTADVRRYDGMFHGFVSMADTLPEAEQAATVAFTALRTALTGADEAARAPVVQRMRPTFPARDLDAAVELLTAVLDRPPTFVDGGRWAQFDLEEGLGSVALSGEEGESDVPALSVKVTDLGSTTARLRNAGYSVGHIVTGSHERRAILHPGAEKGWLVVLYEPMDRPESAPIR